MQSRYSGGFCCSFSSLITVLIWFVLAYSPPFSRRGIALTAFCPDSLNPLTINVPSWVQPALRIERVLHFFDQLILGAVQSESRSFFPHVQWRFFNHRPIFLPN